MSEPLKVRVDAAAPAGNVVVLLATLLRRLRDDSRAQVAPKPSPSPLPSGSGTAN